jgi:hypothetical protein
MQNRTRSSLMMIIFKPDNFFMELTVVEKNQKVIDTSISVFRTAPEILKANQLRSSKAKTVGENILQQWNQAWTITDEEQRMQSLAAVDERSNKYLVNCSTALKQEKESRAAITQMMDLFKKMFIDAETDLDKSKDGTTTAKVQGNRDKYVSESLKIQERKRKEAEQVANKAKEAVVIKSNIEKSLQAGFSDYLLQKKQKLQSVFNSLVLDTFADDAAGIRLYEPKFSKEHFANITALTGLFSYHKNEEITGFVTGIKSDLHEKLSAQYVEEMSAMKSGIVDKLPSKFEELKEQKRLADQAAETKRLADEAAKKTKDAAEKKRLQDLADKAAADQAKALQDQKDRELQEQDALAQKAQSQKTEAQQAIDIKAQGDQTMIMFEQEAAVAETTPTPAARLGFEIEILHPVGVTQIFALWFENEGKNLPIDKILNTKVDQMKTWAEKYALKTSTKIESKFLKYEDSVKAVNKKAK